MSIDMPCGKKEKRWKKCQFLTAKAQISTTDLLNYQGQKKG